MPPAGAGRRLLLCAAYRAPRRRAGRCVVAASGLLIVASVVFGLRMSFDNGRVSRALVMDRMLLAV
jgi:hypothetical protein